jgi:hypothetical protein
VVFESKISMEDRGSLQARFDALFDTDLLSGLTYENLNSHVRRSIRPSFLDNLPFGDGAFFLAPSPLTSQPFSDDKG